MTCDELSVDDDMGAVEYIVHVISDLQDSVNGETTDRRQSHVRQNPQV